MKRLMREYEHLCTLGLPTREVVPLALRLLERRIGGSLFGFIWADERLEAVDMFTVDPLPESQALLYSTEFYNRREAEVGPTFTDILRDKIDLVNFSSLGRRMFGSAMYAEVFLPMGMPHALRASVIDGEHRHGMFAITRPPGRGFSERDEEAIRHAARYLAFAFALERAGELTRGETVDELGGGFLLLDRSGRVQHGDAAGLRLFYEATRADGLHLQPASSRETLPAKLADEAATGLPTREITLSNRRGEFAFRPLLLNPTTEGAPPMIAVTVRRRGSMATRLWQESMRFNLSGRERQIAVLLGLDASYDDIARHLGLSRNTAVSYVRRTYEKIGVHQREQLLRQLLAPAAHVAKPR